MAWVYLAGTFTLRLFPPALEGDGWILAANRPGLVYVWEPGTTVSGGVKWRGRMVVREARLLVRAWFLLGLAL